MSDRAQNSKQVIVIRFAIKIEVNGNDVQVVQEPFEQQHQQTRCRSRSKRQAAKTDPRCVGGKNPAFLYEVGLLPDGVVSPPPCEESSRSSGESGGDDSNGE